MKEERAHVVAVPFPLQGHINPMLQFSKRIASKGLKVTLVIFSNKHLIRTQNTSINIEFCSDYNLENEDGSLNKLRAITRQELPKIAGKHRDGGYPVRCIVYDALMPWNLEMARELGVHGAALFTQCSAVNYIFKKFNEGKLSVNGEEEEVVLIEGLPELEVRDLPSFFYESEKYPTALSLMANQVLNVGEADWVFFNTFNCLEDEVLRRMTSEYPIRAIGPTVPSIYLDKRVEDNKEYGINFFDPSMDTCIKWLDSREVCSVIYVSFGSIADIEKEQMEEIANGLKASDNHFLWVVRESEVHKLPKDFLDENSEKGLIVNWCPQLEVLAHKSIGCFITHCGWNSTLEALSLGVPMVAMPQWADQTTNAKFVADVWQIGVRVRVDKEGIVKKEEVELCIREVMEGERSKEIRKNCENWKKLAKEAVDEGGSSEKNINEFVEKLMHF